MRYQGAPETDRMPTACGICGINPREHCQQWKEPVGWHTWQMPAQQQIKARMLARRFARLVARAERPNVRFHATANWSGSHVPDDEGQMFCADCGRDNCPRFLRIQAHLDRLRWGLPSRGTIPIF